jgi:hypothetical protein
MTAISATALVKAVNSVGMRKWSEAVNMVRKEFNVDAANLDQNAVKKMLDEIKTKWSVHTDLTAWNMHKQAAGFIEDTAGRVFPGERRILINPYIGRPSPLWDSVLKHEVAHAVFVKAGTDPERFGNATNETMLITAHHKVMQATGIDPQAGKRHQLALRRAP